MAIHVLDLMGKLSSRFVHELLPVALASVIGTLVVNHYGRQQASPSVVVQSQPSASENAIAQSLREDHELIASFMKSDQDRETDDKLSESFGAKVASVAQNAFSLVDPPLPEPRPAARRSGRAACAESHRQEEVRADGGPGAAAGPSRDCAGQPAVVATAPPLAQLDFEPRRGR